jgi:hypothetical protein
VEDCVLRDVLRNVGGRLERDYNCEDAPLSNTMLEQLRLLHDAERSIRVPTRGQEPARTRNSRPA